jgi:hypothetical protein
MPLLDRQYCRRVKVLVMLISYQRVLLDTESNQFRGTPHPPRRTAQTEERGRFLLEDYAV